MVFIAGSEHGSSPAPALTSVTYGGQSLSKVNDVSVGSGPTAHVEIWILDEAGVAAATDSSFVPTWSAAPDLPMYSHAFFGNVDQATPTGAQAGEATNSSTPNPLTTVALATNNGDTVVAGAVAGNDGTYTPQNGFTLGNEQIAGTTTTLGTAYIQTVGGTETPSMQHSNPNRQVIAGVVLNMSPQVPAPSLVSVTYGGQSLTKENDVSVGTTTTARVEIWILDEYSAGDARARAASTRSLLASRSAGAKRSPNNRPAKKTAKTASAIASFTKKTEALANNQGGARCSRRADAQTHKTRRTPGGHLERGQ